MKLKYIIIDDEPLAHRLILKYAEKILTLELLGKCTNAFEGIDMVLQKKPNLVFLDINMPNMSGMDFLRTIDKPPMIIITTAYQEYALESYDYGVTDYLMKPFSFERFSKAVQKAYIKHNLHNSKFFTPDLIVENCNHFYVKSNKEIIRLNYDDINFIESYGNYIKIHNKNDTIMVLTPLKKIMESLPPRQFMRVHQSFIIALNKIIKIEGNMIHSENNRIPIGKSFRQDFFKEINAKL